jgi:tetratricopeptide (TPR) repeat protein
MKPSTRLSVLIDGVLEMGWLVAVVVTPLFFNVYSSRVFEPDKLTILRSIALVMAALWAVKYIDGRASGGYEPGFTWRTPLVFPTLFTVAAYVASTALSVSPRISFLGSYQRLQGTYTTLAYIVVFLIILQGMRTRAQLDRLVTVAILNSFPIALYGLIQRNKLDPLPWGGDVTRRVASNMGNAIFVAAYLIMVVPPTLARVLSAFQSVLTDKESDAVGILRAAGYVFVLLLQCVAILYTQSRGPLMGLLMGLGVWGWMGVLSLQQAARREEVFKPSDLLKDLAHGLAFGFGSLAAAGVAAVLFYFIGRMVAGPESDLSQGIAALAAVSILLGLWLVTIVNRRGWRWLWASALVLAVFAGAGFFAVNPGGSLHDWSQQQPSLRRITSVLEPGNGTGMVRNLIWRGGEDLLSPHAPIQYPPTKDYPEGHPDPFNVLRPVVGYGPESMYVVYNSFYPPLLGHYESRTASPDRSHNETMDSLVIGGILGFVAYLWIFGSVFTFGLHWLGFLPPDWRRILFYTLLAAGAIVATAVVIPIVGPHFFGLAIPVGMVGGLFVYLVVYGCSVYWEAKKAPEAHPYAVLLVSILAAVVAHFIEINFGIAIASTRTAFWAYAGVLVVAGMGLIREGQAEDGKQKLENQELQSRETRGQGRRRRKRRGVALTPPSARSSLPGWLWPTVSVAVVGGFILGTLSFDFVTNADRLTRPMRIIWHALTVLPAQQGRTSYGALMLFALTWLMGAVICISEMTANGAFRERKGDGRLATALYLLISLGIGLGFALVLAGRQGALMEVQARTLEDVIRIADQVAGFLTIYYGFILCVLVGGGVVLVLGVRRPRHLMVSHWSVMALVVLLVLAGGVAVSTNLQPIQADVVYKQAEPYEEGKQWLVAVEHYKHAVQLAPKEDFYYLYLGRAYMEYGSTIEDVAVREVVMRETEQTLLQAREINPLNTDHSANLARMYSRWVDSASDDEARAALAEKADTNYRVATILSPNNVLLWNEWALLYLSLGDVERAQEKATRSLELDSKFDETWWKVQASIHARQGLVAETIETYERALQINPRQADAWLLLGDVHLGQDQLREAAEAYENALELKPNLVPVWRVLGSLYARLDRLAEAAAALERALELAPEASDAWDTHRALAVIYIHLDRNEKAFFHAGMALQLAPNDQRPQMEQLVQQLQQSTLVEQTNP